LLPNRLFNGTFDRSPTTSPFDWRISQQPGVRVSLDDGPGDGRGRVAKLSFDGTENVTVTGLSQRVWLPSGRYRLQAMIRTEGITTREGVAVEVRGDGVAATSKACVGTTDWTQVSREFDVPDDAGLLQVRVVRNKSFRFDNLIAGTAWLDDVEIVPVEAGQR
jgi:hypothetical protein